MLDPQTADHAGRALWMREFDPGAVPPAVRAQLDSLKNTDAAFGERMRAYLDELLHRKSRFIPSYRKRYELFRERSAELTPQQAYVMSNLLGSDTVDGYALLPESSELTFPRDHRVSLTHQVGWHFFVGTARASDGRAYGIELMFWQWALLPPPLAARLGLSDIENQIMEMHLAISEEGGRHYRAAPLVVAGTTGLLEVRDDPFFWAIGKNRIESARSGDLFPMRMQGRGWDRGAADAVEIAIDLAFSSGKGILLQGGNGCAPCCAGVGTLYYSIPAIVLDGSSSSIEIGGRRIELASGKFWMDHQWGTGFLPSGAPVSDPLRAAAFFSKPGPGGWDWFPLQFDNGWEITVAAMHSNDHLEFYFQTGPNPPGVMTVPVSGKIMDPQAVTRSIAGTLSVTEWVRATHTNDKAYPPSGSWYPNKWEFSFPDAPAPMHALVMVPLVGGGQTGYFGNGAEYLEGATVLQSPDGRAIGIGFGEATAYANTRSLQAKMANLPDGDATIELLKPPEAGAFERLAATLYLLWPPNGRQLKSVLECCTQNGLT